MTTEEMSEEERVKGYRAEIREKIVNGMKVWKMESIKELTTLFSCGKGTLAFKSELDAKLAGNTGICGYIWKQGERAWRCATCAHDEPW